MAGQTVGRRFWGGSPKQSPQRRTVLTIVSSERAIFESLDRLSRMESRPDVRTLLDDMGPLVVKGMRADRGFIRLFPGSDREASEDLGLTGLTSGAAIGLVERAFMERLLAGRCVRDGHTLLVPIICQHRTIGFFCLDRHLASTPFTDADGHFLIGIGQAMMTLVRRSRKLGVWGYAASR